MYWEVALRSRKMQKSSVRFPTSYIVVSVTVPLDNQWNFWNGDQFRKNGRILERALCLGVQHLTDPPFLFVSIRRNREKLR